MPFLVASVLADLAERRISVRLVAHPVINVTRDDAGRLIAFSPRAQLQSRESFIHIHIDRVEEDAERNAIVHSLAEVLEEARRSVNDWQPMLARVGILAEELARNPHLLPPGEIAEAIAFLQWLVADNFTFLGMRDYQLIDGQHFEPRHDTALGVLRHRDMRVLQRDRELVSMTPEILAFLNEPKVLIITKSNVRSRVHRH